MGEKCIEKCEKSLDCNKFNHNKSDGECLLLNCNFTNAQKIVYREDFRTFQFGPGVVDYAEDGEKCIDQCVRHNSSYEYKCQTSGRKQRKCEPDNDFDHSAADQQKQIMREMIIHLPEIREIDLSVENNLSTSKKS